MDVSFYAVNIRLQSIKFFSDGRKIIYDPRGKAMRESGPSDESNVTHEKYSSRGPGSGVRPSFVLIAVSYISVEGWNVFGITTMSVSECLFAKKKVGQTCWRKGESITRTPGRENFAENFPCTFSCRVFSVQFSKVVIYTKVVVFGDKSAREV